MRGRKTRPLRDLSIASVFLIAFFLSLSVIPAPAADTIEISYEVLEASGNARTDVEQLKEIHFMVIHHANGADRQTLSTWLKTNSGREVRFVVAGNVYLGVLYRLAHCFGRGLLVYAHEIEIRKGDTFELRLPVELSR